VNVFAAHPRAEVSALCDLDEQKLAQTADAFKLPEGRRFTRYHDFLNAPLDIVVIATPIAFHAQQTIDALASGRHVLCEQTAAYTLEDCERVVNAVKQTGLTYMMAENYCYFHYLREWKKLIEAGRLGKIFYAEAEYIHEIVHLLVQDKTGKLTWRHERPPIWYCAHCLGPILMLMDDRIVKATGAHSGFNMFPDRTSSPGFLDMEVGLFLTRKGAVVKILRSQTARRPHLVWYTLYGTKGTIENNRLGGDGGLYLEGEMPKQGVFGGNFQPLPCPLVDPDAPEEAKTGGHGTSEFYMIRDFLDAIETKRRPPIDVMRAMDFTVPGLIAHEAAMRGGKWMEVPLFNW
jgi:predicted dehydrogenase